MSPITQSKGSPSLKGIRVLVGRARHQAGSLSAELRKLGAQVIEIPFIEIRKPASFRPLDSALKNLDQYDWLILTSVNGVDAMRKRMERLGLQVATGAKDVRVAAIGPATKKAIEQQGIEVDVVPKEYIAESVVRSLRSKVRNKKVLLVRAKVARDVIPRELRRAGAEVEVVEAYETVVPQSSKARLRALWKHPDRRPHVVTFTSSSTVKNFAQLIGANRKALNGTLMASIGPVTSATLRELGFPVNIAAKEYTIPGLIAALTKTLAARSGKNANAGARRRGTKA